MLRLKIARRRALEANIGVKVIVVPMMMRIGLSSLFVEMPSEGDPIFHPKSDSI